MAVDIILREMVRDMGRTRWVGARFFSRNGRSCKAVVIPILMLFMLFFLRAGGWRKKFGRREKEVLSFFHIFHRL